MKDKPLRGRCGSCLAPDGVLFILENGVQEHLCKKCAQQQALWQVADEQLQALLLPSFTAWEEIWGDVPGLGTGSNALSGFAARLSTLEKEVKRERESSLAGGE